MLNPLNYLKYQYSGLFAILTYREMATKGAMTFHPYWGYDWAIGKVFPKLGSFTGNFFEGTTGSGGFLKNLSGFALGKTAWSGDIAAQGIAKSIGLSGDVAAKFAASYKDEIGTYLGGKLWTTLDAPTIQGIVSSSAKKAGHSLVASRAVAERFAAPALRSAMMSQTIQRIGSVLGPLNLGITIGATAANVLGMAFKGAYSATQFVNARLEHMRNLEFGGSLGPGYQTNAATTERMAAARYLQSTPLSANRFMGNEASVYSRT